MEYGTDDYPGTAHSHRTTDDKPVAPKNEKIFTPTFELADQQDQQLEELPAVLLPILAPVEEEGWASTATGDADGFSPLAPDSVENTEHRPGLTLPTPEVHPARRQMTVVLGWNLLWPWAAGVIVLIGLLMYGGYRLGQHQAALSGMNMLHSQVMEGQDDQVVGEAADVGRQQQLQAVVAALGECSQQAKKYVTGSCDSVDHLKSAGYLHQAASEVTVVVGADGKQAAAYFSLAASVVQCDFGTGTQRFYVYHTSTQAYRTECLSEAPTAT